MSCLIKICGINNAAFAADAASVADYLGFIFEPSSPRFVTSAKAKEIIAASRGGFKSVGVFVRHSVDEIISVAREVGLDTVQIHRETTADDVAALHAAGLTVWATGGTADGILVDAPKPGSGKRSDWTRAAELSASGVFTILAGGLSAANIKDAARTGASVLDVNSSLETSPGCKSSEKLRELASAIGSL